MIELSIYKKTTKKKLIMYIGIGILTMLALYFLFPTYGPISFFLTLIIFIFIISSTEQDENYIGVIYLTDKQIIIRTNHSNIKAEIFGIRKLKFTYSGYKGKRLSGDFFPRYNQFSGIDNFISIDLGKKVYEYRFLVEDEIKEKQLIELISDWEKAGFDVSNISLNI